MSEKRMEEHLKSLACLLHSAFFGVFSALKEEFGFFEAWNRAINRINALNLYLEFIEDKDLEDLFRELEKTGIYEGLELKQEGNKITFKIGKCLFANSKDGVHQKLRLVDIPCPLALFFGTYLARQYRPMKVYAYPTAYDKEGSTTDIELLSPEKYKEKMNVLREIVEAERKIQRT